MKMIELKSVQTVHGVTRHPNDGAVIVSDYEAQILVDEDKVASDVTGNYTQEDLGIMAPYLIGY